MACRSVAGLGLVRYADPGQLCHGLVGSGLASLWCGLAWLACRAIRGLVHCVVGLSNI